MSVSGGDVAMLVLTEEALFICDHGGRVQNEPSQDWVRIAGSPVLIQPDPEGRTIKGCPNRTPTTKPCTRTLPLREGYSTLVFVDGHAVCLMVPARGLTDGSPPGVVNYKSTEPGQEFVEVAL